MTIASRRGSELKDTLKDAVHDSKPPRRKKEEDA